MPSFLELGVRKDFVKALKELNILIPTQIQEQSIPVLLNSNTDFIGLAQTGTGKTAAYGLPILHQIEPSNNQVQVLILAPTRELVQQIKKQLFKFTKYSEEKIFAEGVYGGEKIEKQISALKRPTHIIIATPGRLLDLINRGDINIKQVKTLVLDEADEMLSMGFKDDLNSILKHNTSKRHTWLFSATMPEEIQTIVKTYMSPQAVKVEINKEQSVNKNITHQYISAQLKEKFNILVTVLGKRANERGIIFCRTKAGTKDLTEKLLDEGFAVAALEGDMKQKDRDKVMRAFKKGSLQILISTDVSARGIDVNDLEFVIHHQLPEQLEYYTHRSGRTARAGKKGDSIALIIPGEMQKILDIQKALNIQIKETII